MSLVAGTELGMKAAILVLAARCLTLTFSFSSGTNDTSRVRLSAVILLAIMAIGTLGFIGLGIGCILVTNPATAWLLLAIAVVDAYALFRVYGWFYRANCFDLMTLPST
jgi:hypothetical protein